MREQLFACEANFLLGYLDRVENATEEQLKLAASMFAEQEDDDDVDDIYEETESGVRIRIEGTLSMDGPPPIARLFGYKGTGYRAIMSACARAAASASKAVTYLINSPGGLITGMDQAWQSMRALASMKPCSAVNVGMMASAAYELASAVGPRNIFATSPACEQGSIGVKMVAIVDTADGRKEITIVSKNAPKKDDNPATAKGRSIIQDRCDAMERQFIARIAEGRGISTDKVIANFGQGGVLTARDPAGEPDALKAGMIDGIIVPEGMPKAATGAAPMLGALAALAAQTETPPPANAGANHENRRKTMPSLNEFIATDANARAEYDKALKAEFDRGRASIETRMTAAKPYLALQATKDGYDAAEVAQIGKAAIDVIMGTEEPGGLRSFVRMIDMNVEKRKQAAAQAETDAQKETPGQQQTLSAGAGAIGADGNAAKAEVDLQALVARENAADGVKK